MWDEPADQKYFSHDIKTPWILNKVIEIRKYSYHVWFGRDAGNRKMDYKYGVSNLRVPHYLDFINIKKNNYFFMYEFR